jgi:hypothetical protein
MTFHRRTQTRRAGGNSFYLDRSDRGGRTTVCGAPATDMDVRFKERMREWTRDSDGVTFTPCKGCVP